MTAGDSRERDESTVDDPETEPALGHPLLISAWNDSGGGFFTRLLDGHPDLLVYPFELQLGTGLGPRSFRDWFPAKYRWPTMPPDPRDAFDAFANDELRAAEAGDAKFAGYATGIDVESWRSDFEQRITHTSTPGVVIRAWLATFFAALGGRPTPDPRYTVGHCPLLALDWDDALTDLPDARMIHVVRSPLAGFVDTRLRRPHLDPATYSSRWSLINTVAALHADQRPDRFQIVRYEDLLDDRDTTMHSVAEWLDIDFADSLLTPSWRGSPLDTIGPFGGVPINAASREQDNVESLDPETRALLTAATASARSIPGLAGPPEPARENFTDTADNLSFERISKKSLPIPLEFETEGDFWGLLDELGVSLLVTREYEHFLLLLGGNGGSPWQSAMQLPHPSGAFVNPIDGSLVVSSTRNPNQIMTFRPLSAEAWDREIVPHDLPPANGTVYLPTTSRVLPGTLYIHDVVIVDHDVYVAATGHNFVARLGKESGWERVWWPSLLDGSGAGGFRENWLQLNSIALGPAGMDDAHLTAFANETTGPKPWKEGYGPEGRGVVFSAESREVVLRGLTCPHSATRHRGSLWLCNSGFGTLGIAEDIEQGVEHSRLTPIVTLPGFTRGLAFAGDHAIVGLSKVIERYEPYAPGLVPSKSRCGLALVDLGSGTVSAQIWWPEGYQIYEVQVLARINRPTLPSAGEEGKNQSVRFLG